MTSFANDPNQFLYDFRIDLERFGNEVEDGALRVFRLSTRIAADAIVFGNEYGPGVAIDTGFAADSFRMGINSPAQGPSEPPLTALQRGVGGNKYVARVVGVQKNKGLQQIRAKPLVDMDKAVLGDTVYVNTMASYPKHLEFNPKRRRFGKNKGMSTEFIYPVEARWGQIVDDSASQIGYGK